MAATTKPIVFAMPENYVVVESNGLPMADGAIVPFGTPVCINTSGKILPVTSTLIAADAIFLGISLDTWDNSNNQYSTTGPRMLFARNCQWDCPLTSNSLGAPASQIGQMAGFVDNQTCSVGSAKALFRVDAILANGATRLWIP